MLNPIARVNTADTTSGYQMMSYSDVETDLNINEHLNLILNKTTH